MHPEAHAELRRFRKEQGAIGSALLFPHARQGQRPGQPVSRHLGAWWLKEAFRRGKLQKPDGSLWPTFRRVWATERKHLRRTTGRSSSAPSSAIWTRSVPWSSSNGLRYRHQGGFKSAGESVEPHGAARSLTHSDSHTSLIGEARRRLRPCRASLPLLGSNQDSPDPEGAQEWPEFQQPATVHASSCHPMLELDSRNAGLCHTHSLEC